jgi:hypothetical protein
MKTRLLIASMVMVMSASARAEEGVLQECLDAARAGTLSDVAESEREMVEQNYTNAVDNCLQDHLTPYAGSGEFSDTEEGLDPGERRFRHFDASRRSVGRRSSSMHQPDSRNPSRMGGYPKQRQRSTHHSRRVVMPRPPN